MAYEGRVLHTDAHGRIWVDLGDQQDDIEDFDEELVADPRFSGDMAAIAHTIDVGLGGLRYVSVRSADFDRCATLVIRDIGIGEEFWEEGRDDVIAEKDRLFAEVLGTRYMTGAEDGTVPLPANQRVDFYMQGDGPAWVIVDENGVEHAAYGPCAEDPIHGLRWALSGRGEEPETYPAAAVAFLLERGDLDPADDPKRTWMRRRLAAACDDEKMDEPTRRRFMTRGLTEPFDELEVWVASVLGWVVHGEPLGDGTFYDDEDEDEEDAREDD